jgi:hypothetical protein
VVTIAIRKKAAAVSIDLRILILRRQKVILHTALADLYNVPVKRLNERVKRNRKRFPADFMFQLTAHENKSLKSQFATSNIGRRGRRSLPYAFSEHEAEAYRSGYTLRHPKASTKAAFSANCEVSPFQPIQTEPLPSLREGIQAPAETRISASPAATSQPVARLCRR